MSTEPLLTCCSRIDTRRNVTALAFGVLIVTLVVVGSLLIMADLNDNMMPAAELMNLQMQH
jgi:cytochrome o ubiquinol oxidase subunit IV